MANLLIFPAAVARSVAAAVYSAHVGGKSQAGCEALSAAIGPSYRVTIRDGSSVVVDAVYQSAMVAVGGVIAITSYTTLAALSSASIGPSWKVRIGRADGSVFVEGAVGTASSTAPFKLSANPSTSKGFAVGSLVLHFDPALDQVEGSALQFSNARMLSDLVAPSEGRALRWIAFVNDPTKVPFVGGPTPDYTTASANVMGAVGRGTTMPTWAQASDLVPASHKDSDIWPLYTPWMIAQRECPLGDPNTSLHSATNIGLYSGRAEFWIWRISQSRWVLVRGRSNQQNWFRATEDWLIYQDNNLEQRSALPSEGDGTGTVIRVDTSGAFAIHGTGIDGPELGFSVSGPGIDLSAIASDIGCVAVANVMGLVPWDPNLPVNWSAARMVVHVGCDSRGGVGGWPPGIMLSKQWRLSSTIRPYEVIALRDTMRQDRVDKSSDYLCPNPEAGFTMAQAVANPIPGWV